MMAIPVNAKRLALVMGNDNYISVSKLQKAGNDADAMARELKAAGFAVALHKDLNYRRMVKAIDAFIESITGGDEVVVFYAGHGVQIKTGAHLLPVDIEAESESQIEKTAYGLNDLTEKLSEAKPAFTLVMVDACRDNPMKAKGRAVGNARGLNALEPPKGQIVVYSASRGQQALDRLSDNDSNPNGVFTREFITHMRTPGMRIEDMMREVQDSVESLAKSVRHEQRPAVYNEARGNFYFYGPTTVQIQQGGDDSEAQTWAAAQAANSVAAFQTYLDLFPKGRYAGPAKIKLDAIKQSLEKPSPDAETDLWAEVKTTGTREYLEAYLKQYPSGRYVALARMELKKLDDAEETKNAKLALEAQQAKQREEQQAQRIEQTVWDQARTADTVASYATYLEKYPSGRFMSQAKAAKSAAEALLAVAEYSEKARLEAEARWVAREQVASINPEMVVIPAGTFVMGSNNSPLEQPTHSVAVRSFLMGKTEVTQELWMSVMGINPSQNKGRALPVDRVSWDDVQQFIAKLNQRTGQMYRLPSEAEWEYAARAGTTTEWSHGNNESALINYAWYDGNSGRKTQEVGQKLPNAFGLYDMHGNVWELTQDCWHETYAGAPTDGSAWTTGCAGNKLVVRGGSWFYWPAYLRSAFRFGGIRDTRYLDYGFRLASDLPTSVQGSVKKGEDDRPIAGSEKPNGTTKQVKSALNNIQIIKDCTICPEMVPVPQGNFMMGASDNDRKQALEAGLALASSFQDQPQHPVIVSRFLAARFAVTKDQFSAFVNATAYKTEAEWRGGCSRWHQNAWEKQSVFTWNNPGFFQNGDHPVVCVSWNDAQAYVKWLTEITGKAYRLLNESEREYATRGGKETAFWWGDSASSENANYLMRRNGTLPVNSFEPNPFGLYNVHGNVSEWTQDCVHKNYEGAPNNGSAWMNECISTEHIIRGGSWRVHPSYMRASYRFWREPWNNISNDVGFRVARDL